jgi:hypothetical protein
MRVDVEQGQGDAPVTLGREDVGADAYARYQRAAAR